MIAATSITIGLIETTTSTRSRLKQKLWIEGGRRREVPAFFLFPTQPLARISYRNVMPTWCLEAVSSRVRDECMLETVHDGARFV